ncbi:MAG TPA: hypothetical protein VEC11_02430 [Allosphingosinicella sp.]|nr:hypothetical protein [Allosphingosinicella sp.]
MRRSFLLAALAGSLIASPALADVTVRYRAVIPENAPANVRQHPPTLTVSADGAGQARMEMTAPGDAGAQPPGVAFITREGTGYAVLSAPGGGPQIVARVDDALALVGQFAAPLIRGGSMQDGAQQVLQQRVEIHPVGPEVVNGVQGNLYRIVLINGETRAPPMEVVIATDPRLAPVGQEFARFFESVRPTIVSLLGREPQVYMALRGMMGLGAPLRVGDQLRIDSVSTEDVPDSRFALPGPAMSREQLQQIAQMMMGMMRQGQGAQIPGMPSAAPPAPATPPANATNPH